MLNVRNILSKSQTLRTAVAEATLRVSTPTIEAIKGGRVPKGDPLTASKVAAIVAAKATPQILPYCHSVGIERADVDFELNDHTIVVRTTIGAVDKTGVEMEALTAASVAALNLYDMLKMIDDEMEIESIRLLEKHGGKSDFPRVSVGARCAVIVASDGVSAGKREDRSGEIARQLLSDAGFAIDYSKAVEDDEGQIQGEVKKAAESGLDLLLITGGTGLSTRDVTPEAVEPLLDRRLPGVEEAMRRYGSDRNPFAVLSRSLAGVRGNTLILCVPGSPSGVRESLASVINVFPHALHIIKGGGHGGEG